MCAQLTQDHHIFAVAGNGLSDNFSACMNNAGVLQSDSGEVIQPDQGFFQDHPYYFNSGTLSQDRMMGDYVSTLVQMGYFGGWDSSLGRGSPAAKAKVGVLSAAVPEWERPLDHVLLPGLARAGYPVSPGDVIRITNPETTSQDAITAEDVQNGTLKLHADGVTHVILLDANGSLMLLFGNAAKSQHYYPRMGINTASAVQALYDNHEATPDQLNGAVGLGWNPDLDLPFGASDRYATPATRHCLAVMKKYAGQTFSNVNAAGLAFSYCDDLYLITDAINAAGPSITRSTARAAIEALGPRFDSAGLPATFFSPARHDAGQLGFQMAWNGSCPCVQYVGPPHQIP
jgi:hypothetical protein